MTKEVRQVSTLYLARSRNAAHCFVFACLCECFVFVSQEMSPIQPKIKRNKNRLLQLIFPLQFTIQNWTSFMQKNNLHIYCAVH